MPPYTSTSVLTKQLLGIVLNQQIVMEDSVQGRSSFMGHDVPSVIDTSLYTRGNTVHYFKYINDGKTRQQSEINIHELANKCKDYLLDNKAWSLSTYKDFDGLWFAYATTYIDNLTKKYKSFQADSEPEAIFKACVNFILLDDIPAPSAIRHKKFILQSINCTTCPSREADGQACSLMTHALFELSILPSSFCCSLHDQFRKII